MMKTILAGSAALLLGSCAMAGQTGSKPPAGLSWYVISQINDFYNDPDDPTNRPPLLTAPPAGVVSAIDVNADGVKDWLVTWPDSSQFCGTGGCRVTVYLTHGQNLVRIFDRQTLEPLAFTTVDGEARFDARLHQSACSYERDDCRLAWGLDTVTRKLVPRASANGDRYAVSDEQTTIDPIWDEPI